MQRCQLAQLRRLRVRRVRRTKQCCRATCDRFQQELCRIEFEPDVLGPAKGKVWMIISMVPYFVPFLDNATHESRITLRIGSDQEKRSLDVRRFQNVQNLRRPLRAGAIIEGYCDLMFAAFPLMIERRKLREFHVVRCEITFGVDRKISPSVRTALIDRDNFAIAHVGDRVRAFQDFERLPRLIVELEIALHA